MERLMSVKDIMSLLRKEKIHTWFDLGLFIDLFKESKKLPTAQFTGTYKEFKKEICSGGLAFISFHFSVDGITVEVEKYVKVFRKNYKNIPIHYIAGIFHPESEKLIDPRVKKFKIDEIRGFDDWKLYKEFYFIKLERGSKEYNALIIKFWDQVLTIVEKLGHYVESNNINLFYLLNVCSNPGNVALTLAVVLLSEYLGIPVINNNHDFYWEDGNKKIDILQKGLKNGPRDFFFTNADVGEFFSQLEVLLPWESRLWMNVNINKGQSDHIIKKNGHNPANVTEIGTAVDTNEFINISKRQKINAFHQFEKILSRYQKVLVGYSVTDVKNNKLVDTNNPRPILIGAKTKPIEKFLAENVIFLQPTRIIARKRIELGFKLVKKMFNEPAFTDKLRKTSNLKLTIIVTGPIATGHYNYFERLIRRFSQLLNHIHPEYRSRLYLAFLFSELDKEIFKKKFENPVGIPELYNISSLVLLPSKTEGRGLPIIEATACGTPILCRRYAPLKVYSEVIGEHLPEKDRLKVIEFDGKNITPKHVRRIIDRVFYPHRYTDEIIHNKNAVQKRYSLEALDKNICDICYRLYLQLKPNEKIMQLTEEALDEYKEIVNFSNNDLKAILDNSNRHYLPGYGRLSFMLYLKSLIDPSFFRVEQQEVRGFAFEYAHRIIMANTKELSISLKKTIDFYNAIDNIFHIRRGETIIRHDHSMSYRHRNRYYYPYQDFTIQELTGLVQLLYFKIIQKEIKTKVDETSHFFTDWNLALAQLTSSSYLAIDNRKELIQKLKANLPIVIFPGDYIKYELEFFALQSVRSRLKLKLEEELTEEILEKHAKNIAPVYVFVQERTAGRRLKSAGLREYILKGPEGELKLLYKYRILRIVATSQLCAGIHFSQLGEEAIKILRRVRSQKGFIISNRGNAAVMTDIVDIDRFHIGRALYPVTARIMGIPEGSGYIQFVPAGLRTTIAYPTPVQTAKDFDTIINSKVFKELSDTIGKEKIMQIIKDDAEKNGSPLEYILEKLSQPNTMQSDVESKFVSGLYWDGMPWNGAMAKLDSRQKNWQFSIVTTKDTPKTVLEYTKEFNKRYKKKSRIAWNGGYILNPELVGKLGLPEAYIGSPLGLIITNQKVVCPPLFNKPALLIYENGEIDIKRVCCSKGMKIKYDNIEFELSEENYNKNKPNTKICYYDLLYPENEIPGNRRIIVRLAGNVIKQVIHTKKNENVQIIPVGITLSFDPQVFPEDFNTVETELQIELKNIEGIKHAVEAGPLLVDNGKQSINMEVEGWKTQNSIKTQAARLDYTDMRGPKIAVGVNDEGEMVILTINGRIRESVGATHIDMANIMLDFGMTKAMGFDPGGSSTLVVDGKTLNISPYNKEYEKDIYSLPPQPRAVSNAVIGYIDE